MSSYNDFDHDDDRHEYSTGGFGSYKYGESSHNERHRSDHNDDDRYEYGVVSQAYNGTYSVAETFSFKPELGRENKVFTFDAAGEVTGVGEIGRYGQIKVERIDFNETYSVVDGYVIKEEVSRYGQTEWTVYADGNGDGRYAEVAEGKGAIDYLSLTQSLDQLGPNVETLDFKLELGRENKVFTFDAAGAVTAVGEVGRYGQIKAERIDFNETYEMVGDFVVKTETSRYGQTEWSVYADGDGDNRWAEIAEGHGPVSADLLAQLIPVDFATFG